MHVTRYQLFSFLLAGEMVLFPFAVVAQTNNSAQPPVTSQYQNTLQLQLEGLQSQLSSMTQDTGARIHNGLLNYLNVKTSPKNPGPNEHVRITIESYSTNLDKATISWVLDGITILSGVGKRVADITIGPSGHRTQLHVYVTTNSGESLDTNLSWSPVGLTAIWEAETYTPPFYKGKALVSPQARIHVVAIPDSSTSLDSGNFAYVWKENGRVVTNSSGYRMNSFSLLGSKPYGKSVVSVTASSVGESQTAEKSFDISLTAPFILFYENSPLLGTWYNHPIGTDFSLAKKEFSMTAEPFFFSSDGSDTGALQYSWSVNDSPTQNSGRAITLRNDTGAQGDSSVSLSLSNPGKLFQHATHSLRVHFGASGDSGGSTIF